jgi:hypothetical protein
VFFWSAAKSHGQHHGGPRAVGKSAGPRTGSPAAVSGGDGWIESAASRFLKNRYGEWNGWPGSKPSVPAGVGFPVCDWDKDLQTDSVGQ